MRLGLYSMLPEMKPAILPTVLAALCLLAPVSLQAQDSSLVTVLSFTDSTGGDGDVADALYNAVRAQIELHREYSLNDVPPQTLDDLLLALGCASLDADCSAMVSDIVQSQFLAWGELVANAENLGVRMVLWDLGAAAEIRSVAHLLDIESTTTLLEFDAVIGRSLLYGASETLTVDSTPPGAAVWIDGEEVGVTPLELANVALGIYDVEFVLDGHHPTRRTAVVDLGGARVVAELDPAPVERVREGPSAFSETGPWLLVGGGGALVVAGVVSGAMSRGTQNEFDDVVAAETLDRGRAEDLRGQGESQARVANVFMVAGAALVAGGVVWRLVGDEHEDEDEEGSPWANVGGFVGQDGGGVTLTFLR